MADSRIREQYEKFPYPPIPFLALPRRGEGVALQYPGEHAGIRILVAGCGTLEAAIVAQTHPRASEIVAVDLSETSIKIARKRLRWLRIARPLRPLPPVRFIAGDLHELQLENFDYVVASNLLQHSENPAALLRNLAHTLKPGGYLRMVTYPKGSRYWMRRTSRWLAQQGLNPDTPSLVTRAHHAIRTLPAGNPIRSCFESQPETRTRTGLVDAFFNACENPLSPLEWQQACENAGLELEHEAQNEASRSDFLDSFLKKPKALSAWEKLQILDATWELCANPILWLKKVREAQPFRSPPTKTRKLAEQLDEANALLGKAGSSLAEFQIWLRNEVGPRVNPRHPDELLRGLTFGEYDLKQLYLLSDLELEDESDLPARL